MAPWVALRSSVVQKLARSFATTRSASLANTMSTRSAPPTFGLQASLPRLPVPQLEDSLNRYLRSLEPILQQQEDLGELPTGATAASELAKRRTWADELLKGGLGQRLNERLHDVDATTENNWFNDRFWVQKAYHEWRAPLLINSDWWLMLRNDPNMPVDVAEDAGDAPAYSRAAITDDALTKSPWGVRRATWLVYRAALYKLALDHQTIKPDASRAGSFCMHQYSRMFGVTRIPCRPHDWNTATNATARHITVMVRDHIYHLDVFDEHGDIVPLPTLEKSISEIVADAQQRGMGEGVGVLSCDDRDKWTLTREHILQLGGANRANLDSIQSSLFVLSLDATVLGKPEGYKASGVGSQPSYADVMAINTSGAGRLGHNRWFDKAISLVIEPNGRTGILGEHSPADALIPSILGDAIVREPCPAPGTPFPDRAEGVTLLESPAPWRKLEWTLDDKVRADIKSAEETAQSLARESDIGVLWYDEYGADWIKKVARQAPDAYIQMALQIAYAQVHGRQTPTYETASTRFFRHGRTDVIRSFSRESYELVKALREKKPASELYQLLSAATSAHTRQTRDHSFGKGFDRHMAGLRLVFRPEDDGEYPALFSDPLFAESQTWRLSTSGLSAGDVFVGTGFGSGYPEGFGVNYLAGGQILKFGMESKRSNPKGDGHPVAMYEHSIAEALRTMRRIVEEGAPPPEAKL